MYFEKQTLQSDQSITYNGQVKIWYLIVIVVSLIGTGVYITKRRWLWDHALRLVLSELFLFALWFSSGVANFDPWYSGPGLRCDLIRTGYMNSSIEKLAELAELQCNTLIASLSFGWINVGLHVVSLLIARKRASELNWVSMPSGKRISLRPARRQVFF
ncbi:6589_t:CDS:2 [Funneliformis caledonium]|uniref:6589_t:CDS:1 n=1 Tax=Funneliformis caledonium TaxID=1117310 RepID=A0A9N8V992_9GLOM|nr:6589_t:CDS:2 [Funneliformis caledonium]